MKIKNVILVGILTAGFPFAVQAQDVENCESAECQNLNVNYDQQSETNDGVAQIRRTRTRRTRGSDFKKTYVGGTVGLAELGDGADIGFGGSIFAGYRLSEKLGAELEVFDYFGGTEFDDLGYNYLGFAVNGSYRIPFGEESKGIYAFVSPGVGYGRLGFTGDVADEAEDNGFDTSVSGFLAQVKGGIGYPISDSIDLVGQTRYSYLFLGDSDFTDDGEDEDAFTFDLGVTFGF